jgi:colicin import membrane protein
MLGNTYLQMNAELGNCTASKGKNMGNTDIELVTKALSDFDSVAAGLAQLEKTHKGVLFDVETHGGMELAKAARALLRKPRYEVENIRKAAKAPLLAIGKKLDAEAARITTAILALEEPIDQQIKNEEQRKERERIAKIEAEQKRKDDIQARIDAIRSWPQKATRSTSEVVAKLLKDAQEYKITDELFAEFITTAHDAWIASIDALKGIHSERLAHEAEQARIVAERAELQQLRAKQVEQERIERERLAEDERKARVLREAESAKQAESLKAQREELERQARELMEKQKIEEARLAAARAEFERQQAEAKRKEQEAERARQVIEEAERKRKEEADKLAKKSKYPGDTAILSALMQHFEVSEDVVRSWLTQIRKAA